MPIDGLRLTLALIAAVDGTTRTMSVTRHHLVRKRILMSDEFSLNPRTQVCVLLRRDDVDSDFLAALEKNVGLKKSLW